jgi:drug/metabolite transporter (DMT)-like permease
MIKGTTSDKNLSIILLAATSIIWGTSFILIKKATTVFAPLEVGALRIFYAFLAFIPIFWVQRKKIPGALWSWIFLAGLIGSLIPSLLFSWAGTKIQSSLSGMLNAITPLFTILIGSIFYKQTFTFNQWTGILIGLFGAIILGFMKPGGALDINWFVLPVIFATLLYALNVNLLKIKFSGIQPLVLSASTIVSVGPLATIILFGFTDFSYKIMNMPGAFEAAGYVAILGFFGTAIALVLFNKLIQISGPLTASSVTYIMPVISVLWGLADGELFGLVQGIGLFSILLGVYIVNKK